MAERHTVVTARAIIAGEMVDVVDEQIALAAVAYATGELADLIELDVPPATELPAPSAQAGCPYHRPGTVGDCALYPNGCQWPECVE